MSLSIRDLLDAGAHFGHQTHRWNPKMKPYIYGARNGIYIINLEKTARMWARAHQAIVDTVRRGKKVLFVGTKPQAQEVVEDEAARCGQFYVTRRWLGGMLTNFKTIRGRLNRLEEIEKILGSEQAQKFSKKELNHLQKEGQKLAKSLAGIRHLKEIPGLVVVIDPNKEHIAVSEAKKLGIPILAITDTNCDPDGLDYLVPANDDALKSIRLFVAAVADACLLGVAEFERRIQEESRRKLEEKSQPAQAEPEPPSAEQKGEVRGPEVVRINPLPAEGAAAAKND